MPRARRSPAHTRRWWLALLVVTWAAPLRASVPEYKVKAGYLLNFSRYVDWPAAVFSSATQSVQICVYGEDPFGPLLDRTISGRTSHGRPLQVRRLSAPEEIPGCHVLFVPRDTFDADDVMAAVARRPVLTVGEEPDFLDRGGILNFRLVDGHVRFEANQSAATASSLKLSSALLELAFGVRRVQPATAPPAPEKER